MSGGAHRMAAGRLIAILVVVGGCGRTSRDERAPREPAGSAAATPAAATAATAATTAPTAPTATTSPAADPAPAPAAPAPPVAVDVPTEAAALQRWLAAGHYKRWAAESAPHESAGPHGDTVKTFLAPALVDSLAAGRAQHPRGAAAVKELYEDGRHMGWAVSVKVADDSAAGRGWYWYEVFSTEASARPAYVGRGKKLCRECHEDGTDLVLIPFPLT